MIDKYLQKKVENILGETFEGGIKSTFEELVLLILAVEDTDLLDKEDLIEYLRMRLESMDEN